MNSLILQISSEITLTNFDDFKEQSENFINSLNTKFETEDDFAQAESDVKTLKDLESTTKLVLQEAINGSMDTANLIAKTEEIIEMFRQSRLSSEKLVKQEKQRIKEDAISQAKEKLDGFYEIDNATINDALLIKMPKQALCLQISESVKGKKTIDGIRKAINFELKSAQSVIEKITTSLSEREKQIPNAKKYLFPDIAQVIASDNDISLIIENRENAEEKQKQQQERLEQERELAQKQAEKHQLHEPEITTNEAAEKYSIAIDIETSLCKAKTIAKQLKEKFINVRLIKGE